MGTPIIGTGRGERIRTSVRCRSPRGIGCARESAFGGPARNALASLAFPYLRATADRRIESFLRPKEKGAPGRVPPLY